MTSTSQDDSAEEEVLASDAENDEPPSGNSGRWPRALLLATTAGIVAMVCAVLLPLLPVSADRPEVTWPRLSGTTESTQLGLTTGRPLALDAGFACADARAAATTPDGLVLTTAPPAFPDAQRAALTATMVADRLTVVSRGSTLYQGVLPAGPCSVSIEGDLSRLAISIDGVPAGTLPGADLPDVDALATGLAGQHSQVHVHLTLDDQGATSPTPLKAVTIVLLVVAGAVSLIALWFAERQRRSSRGRLRLRRPAVVDAVVPVVLVAWLFLAPMTDDDGYYSAMAANVSHSGYVANYYQLFNQSFTPFTWIYYALGWWQDAVGTAPVALRIPSVALGLATWFLVRAFVRKLARSASLAANSERALRVAVAIIFLGWWLPFDTGVRPEAVVATSVMAALVALATSIEQRRAFPAALAVIAAGIGFTAGTAGFVALAPPIAAAPAVWRALGDRGRQAQILSIVTIIAAGSVVGLLAFADGSLRDFSRAQQIFLGMQYPETWSTEIVRWDYLLNKQGPQGNYAKRLPVLLTLFAVLGYVMTATLGDRDRIWPPRLRLAAHTTVLGFLLLWMTPSKWTHHFGSLAGVGAVLLATVVVFSPRIAQMVSARRPLSHPVAVTALVGVCVLIALAGRGINSWPYSWLLGIPHPLTPPQVWIVAYGQPVWWLLGTALVTAAMVVVARRRAPSMVAVAPWLALPVVVCVAFLATTGYMVGGFAVGAVRTTSTYSPWADALEDPLAHRCGAEQAVQVLDPHSASGLPVASYIGATATGGVFASGGWSPSSPPPIASGSVWGSHRPGPDSADPADGAGAGTFSTPWYSIPTDLRGQTLSLYVSGRAGNGNDLRVGYASLPRTGGAPVLLDSFSGLGEGKAGATVDARQWRSVTLDGPVAPPRGATAVRLIASDTSDGPGGWTAFSAPLVQRWAPLTDIIPSGSATAVGWPIAFLFPCLRKPIQADGINEPVATAVTWGDGALAGVGDSAFLSDRGGLFAPSFSGDAVTQLSARLADAPDAAGLQVYTFRATLPSDGYTVDPGSETVPGWSPAPNTTFSTPVSPNAVVRP
ncbi:arabinosyltransferase domain-containing protein [Actinomycetospora endophytica]|uniref:Arabinosyltransferase domain-containing protein n=1 Tax=Actinomycetospora endophytica TaxID=2291215 RepID=A0ABS8P5L3_9PSEU|nr:arabinosyltransferase domain-containing protein [Actinomycetospora endophytica]MCD2193318.1 arabinosyltransferase domain-containing protein [Actinomycetospora endophytica]